MSHNHQTKTRMWSIILGRYPECRDLARGIQKTTKTWNLTCKQKNNMMLRTGQWNYCKSNTEWEKYQIRKLRSSDVLLNYVNRFSSCGIPFVFYNTPSYVMTLLPWNERAFMTIRYDKISPELLTVLGLLHVEKV